MRQRIKMEGKDEKIDAGKDVKAEDEKSINSVDIFGSWMREVIHTSYFQSSQFYRLMDEIKGLLMETRETEFVHLEGYMIMIG